MQWFHVLYMRPNWFRDGNLGYDTLKERGKLPDPLDLSKTHIYLMPMRATDLNHLYGKMQGESWSPNGEARELIETLGLSHTSMSVGDIAVDMSGKAYIVDRFGFTELICGAESVDNDHLYDPSEFGARLDGEWPGDKSG